MDLIATSRSFGPFVKSLRKESGVLLRRQSKGRRPSGGSVSSSMTTASSVCSRCTSAATAHGQRMLRDASQPPTIGTPIDVALCSVEMRDLASA